MPFWTDFSLSRSKCKMRPESRVSQSERLAISQSESHTTSQSETQNHQPIRETRRQPIRDTRHQPISTTRHQPISATRHQPITGQLALTGEWWVIGQWGPAACCSQLSLIVIWINSSGICYDSQARQIHSDLSLSVVLLVPRTGTNASVLKPSRHMTLSVVLLV